MRFAGDASVAILFLWISGIRPISAEPIREKAFSEIEKCFIGTYLESLEDDAGRDSTVKGKDRGRGRARGQVDAEEGALRGDGSLPPGVELSELPRELESKLPPLPEGLERVLVGGQVVLVEKASRRIQDAFELRKARENGPPTELGVCHVPPGNPSKRKTLSLPEPAIRSHLEHGDYIGPCL